jgi:hypothetical protein
MVLAVSFLLGGIATFAVLRLTSLKRLVIETDQ